MFARLGIQVEWCTSDRDAVDGCKLHTARQALMVKAKRKDATKLVTVKKLQEVMNLSGNFAHGSVWMWPSQPVASE